MQNRFLILHHTRETKCPECDTVVALAGTRSYVVDKAGEVILARNQYPFPMRFSVLCDCGHKVMFSVEEALCHGTTREQPSDDERRLAVTTETALP